MKNQSTSKEGPLLLLMHECWTSIVRLLARPVCCVHNNVRSTGWLAGLLKWWANDCQGYTVCSHQIFIRPQGLFTFHFATRTSTLHTQPSTPNPPLLRWTIFVGTEAEIWMHNLFDCRCLLHFAFRFSDAPFSCRNPKQKGVAPGRSLEPGVVFVVAPHYTQRKHWICVVSLGNLHR